jgi:cobalt-zinc-cadmium efflux system outer membrane protein
VTRVRGTIRLAMLGATIALLWSSPAAAAELSLRLRVDGQMADDRFGFDAPWKLVQIYASRQLPRDRSFDNARNAFQARSRDISLVFESERHLQAVQLDLLKLKLELQTKYVEIECLAGGPL